jgi:tripartite-type tricarboxylate transporter receptor subunit TctC
MQSTGGLLRASFILAFTALLGHPAMAGAQAPSTSSGQAYPVRPVRVIVAFAAGGFADTTTRAITQKLGERLGQHFVVDNRGGAGGNIGARLAAESAPDGYTLLTHTAASSINVTLYQNLGFDLLKDLAPVSNTVSVAGLFTVLAAHPAGNLRELIQMSKGKRLTYATAGVGTSSHIAADYLLRVLAKLDAVHVPFKGGAPAVVAVLGNQVELLNSSAAAVPHVRAGRMKALAVSSLTRIESMPEVPTVAEAGFPGFEERSWVGFFAPAGTSAAVIALLNKEINRALGLPDVASNFKSLGMDTHPGSPADFNRYLRMEVAKWAKMVGTTGVKLD